MARRIHLAAALGMLALPLAGCGASKPQPVLNQTIGIRVSEYRLEPHYVSARPGELRLIVRNKGILTHNVAVETIPKDPTDNAKLLARTATVHPGERAETSFTLGPGRYRLVCTIANHGYLGMFGTLVIK